MRYAAAWTILFVVSSSVSRASEVSFQCVVDEVYRLEDTGKLKIGRSFLEKMQNRGYVSFLGNSFIILVEDGDKPDRDRKVRFIGSIGSSLYWTANEFSLGNNSTKLGANRNFGKHVDRFAMDDVVLDIKTYAEQADKPFLAYELGYGNAITGTCRVSLVR